jgi:uncharacterized membrane protein
MVLIVVARVIHIMAGVTWAGATFVLAAVIVPMTARYGAEGFGRWTALIARKVGPVSGLSALLTVLSGIYLFASLHPDDSSLGGSVLKAGAVAGLLSLATGFLVSRPAGQRLANLSAQTVQSGPTAAPSPDSLEQMAGLRRRVAIGSRLAAALLSVSVLSMALFRYVQALA